MGGGMMGMGGTKAGGGGGDGRFATVSQPAIDLSGIDSATWQDVEAFLAVHPGVEPHAREKLMALEPQLQSLMIQKGSMMEARDQTAMLMGRIKQASLVASGQYQGMKEGDWLCSKCGEHNFARNSNCRSCGTPKPM